MAADHCERRVMLRQIALAITIEPRLVAALVALALVTIIAALMGASVMEGMKA